MKNLELDESFFGTKHSPDWIDPVNGRSGWTHIPFERDDNRVWMDATWAGQPTADVFLEET